MEINQKYFYLLLFVFLFALNDNKAQSSTFYLGGAHTLSLANTGSTFTGISSIYTNPAGLTSLNHWEADISYNRRYSLEDLATTSVAVATKIGNNAVGITVARYGFELYSESKIGLTYARKLFSNLSIGGTFDMLRYDVGQYGAATKFTFELGVQSKISEKIIVGAYVFNPGNLPLTDSQDIPSLFTLGVKYLASKKAKIYVDISKTINRTPDFKFSVDYHIVHGVSLRAGANITQHSIHFGPAYKFDNGLTIVGGYSFDNRLGHTAGLSISKGVKLVSASQ
ncbi:MAG: hypothetical protein V3V14_10985 [Saprospiraceae bacterium]